MTFDIEQRRAKLLQSLKQSMERLVLLTRVAERTGVLDALNNETAVFQGLFRQLLSQPFNMTPQEVEKEIE